MQYQRFPDIYYRGRRLVWDSRQVETDGQGEWIAMSEQTYANADIREKLLARRNGIFEGVVPHFDQWLAERAAESFGEPSKKIKVIGVTGTNGKTSCVEILSRFLLAQGHSVMQMGTLGIKVWSKPHESPKLMDTGFTTPESPGLHHLFYQAVQEKIDYVVMEVSSHSIALNRVWATHFDAAIFTNLSQDHLDFHGSMEKYEEAKAELFTRLLRLSSKKNKYAVINQDDPAGKRILQKLAPLTEISALGFSLNEYQVEKDDIQGMALGLESWGTLKTVMMGDHNKSNLLACVHCLRLLTGLNEIQANRALQDFSGPKGRLERVRANVFVDYAHTPDAMEQVLRFAQSYRRQGSARIWTLFGCGGDRDKTKRPQMGKIAERLSDFVVLSSDNPRSEDPLKILEDIASGMNAAPLKIEVDRAKAIAWTLSQMKEQDILLICGKGHEQYQIIGDQKIYFSDQDEVEKYFKRS